MQNHSLLDIITKTICGWAHKPSFTSVPSGSGILRINARCGRFPVISVWGHNEKIASSNKFVLLDETVSHQLSLYA